MKKILGSLMLFAAIAGCKNQTEQKTVTYVPPPDLKCSNLSTADADKAKKDYLAWVLQNPQQNTFNHISLDVATLNTFSEDYASLKLEPAVINGQVTLLLEGYDQYGVMIMCVPIECKFNMTDPITKTGVFCPPPAGCSVIADSIGGQRTVMPPDSSEIQKMAPTTGK